MARKRSEQRRLDILEAAAELLDERGYLNMTIEEVARRAGAGKQTIYRWWGGKPMLALDAHFTQPAPPPLLRVASVEAELRAHLTATISTLQARPRAGTLAGLLAAAQADPDVAAALRERFLQPQQAALRSIFERGKARGELPSLSDPSLLADLICGPIWYRLLLGHALLDDTLIEALITSTLAAARAPR
jgi:AcrR family transcriptional regulator